MECVVCGASDFQRPLVKSAMEILRCKNCGNDVAVRCHYLVDLTGVQLDKRFVGTVAVSAGTDALKALLKLQKALAFAERFEAGKLAEQHRAGELSWELGEFFDFEVERAAAECLKMGISVTFTEVI